LPSRNRRKGHLARPLTRRYPPGRALPGWVGGGEVGPARGRASASPAASTGGGGLEHGRQRLRDVAGDEPAPVRCALRGEPVRRRRGRSGDAWLEALREERREHAGEDVAGAGRRELAAAVPGDEHAL